MKVNVRAHGALRPLVPIGPCELPNGSRVSDLLITLKLDKGGVWMILVNGQSALRSSTLSASDEVELVPPLGGG